MTGRADDRASLEMDERDRDLFSHSVTFVFDKSRYQ